MPALNTGDNASDDALQIRPSAEQEEVGGKLPRQDQFSLPSIKNKDKRIPGDCLRVDLLQNVFDETWISAHPHNVHTFGFLVGLNKG